MARQCGKLLGEIAPENIVRCLLRTCLHKQICIYPTSRFRRVSTRLLESQAIGTISTRVISIACTERTLGSRLYCIVRVVVDKSTMEF